VQPVAIHLLHTLVASPVIFATYLAQLSTVSWQPQLEQGIIA
jgi:hypothetical protein